MYQCLKIAIVAYLFAQCSSAGKSVLSLKS